MGETRHKPMNNSKSFVPVIRVFTSCGFPSPGFPSSSALVLSSSGLSSCGLPPGVSSIGSMSYSAVLLYIINIKYLRHLWWYLLNLLAHPWLQTPAPRVVPLLCSWVQNCRMQEGGGREREFGQKYNCEMPWPTSRRAAPRSKMTYNDNSKYLQY
jgi:hypothetical protein